MVESSGLPGVVLAEVDGLAHVGVGLGPRLAGLEDLQRGHLVAALAQPRRRPHQHAGSFVGRGRGPARRGGHRDRDGLVGEAGVDPGGHGDDAVGAAGVDRRQRVLGRDATPADDGRHLEVMRRHRLMLDRGGKGGPHRRVVPAPDRFGRVRGQLGHAAAPAPLAATAAGVDLSPPSVVTGGASSTSSSTWRLVWRTKLSLEEFSSRRRTR